MAIEYELIEIAGLSVLPIIAFKTGDKIVLLINLLTLELKLQKPSNKIYL